jgi:GNAT superfamily N-acetyltransferase
MSALPEGYRITERADEIDRVAAHAYLARSYWSPGIPLETVERAIAGSLCIAVLKDGVQVGFARVVTDRATFAYLADVYVLENHRGQGLGKAMIAHLQSHPELQGLRRWLLVTRDMQELYSQFGWHALANPGRAMERHFPDVYA